MGSRIVIGVSGDIRGHLGMRPPAPRHPQAQGRGVCQVLLSAWEKEVGGHSMKRPWPVGPG